MDLNKKIQLVLKNRLYVRGWIARSIFEQHILGTKVVEDIKLKYVNGIPIAWVSLLKFRNGRRIFREVYVYVKPEYRRMGIAKNLIKKIREDNSLKLDRDYPVFSEEIVASK